MFSEFHGLYANLMMGTGLLILLRNLPNNKDVLRIFFAGFAIFFNLRYFHWRLGSTMDPFLSSPGSVWQWAFLLAELIALSALCWHLLVLGWRPQPSEPQSKRTHTEQSPTPAVDIFIATYNESLELLRPTIKAAIAIDYQDAQVHVLDDGDRDSLQEFCESVGVNYVRRTERTHYKSGNLNHALEKTHGEFIVCLDADFVINPAFLSKTLLYFEEPHIGIVQTPQHFRNLDAIQRNLGGSQAWPEDQRVFTDIMQPCRDNWDNAFCYGTNFVVRRACLERIGGFPTESICEDFLLSYRLKSHGWITRYHNEELALGEAADTLNAFVNQRVRWCSGTLQCLFLKDSAFRSTKLSFIDRLFFLDSIAYYLSAIWFFFILISPAIFWWTGEAPFLADNGHLLMMLAPRVLASTIVLYWLTDRKVIPIVSEIGRYVSVYHLIGAIFSTLFRPKNKIFRVTDKGLKRDKVTFNLNMAFPHFALLFVTLAGVIRVLYFGVSDHSSMNENLGLILALTAYACGVTFLSFLACIEPPLQSDEVLVAELPVHEGSIRYSILALVRKVFQ